MSDPSEIQSRTPDKPDPKSTKLAREGQEMFGQERYRVLFERSADANLLIDGDTFIDCNAATVEMLGYRTKEELLQTHPSELSPERQPDGRLSYEKANEMIAIAFERGSHRFEWDHKRADGTVFPVEVLLTAIPFDERHLLHVVWRDLSDRKRAERERAQLEIQLRQAQKMEAFGQLAGGVAHDFNNILTTILGNAELALAEAQATWGQQSSLLLSLEQIEQAGKRAAALTRQLLAFSRRQVTKPELLDLNQTIAEMERMLRRLLTEDIDLRTDLAPALHLVRADAIQVEQVIMNLVVNARDAMPTGGSLTLATANRSLDESQAAQNPGAQPGNYVAVAICDTGVGMDAETLSRAFEPFFTTKGVGEGTGLGLATVYGIIQQAGGYVQVHSKPGEGTRFEALFPAIESSAKPRRQVKEFAEAPVGTETVLLCEDDEYVRSLAGHILGGAGYNVHLASNGRRALELEAELGENLDLLITDVIMPEMNGRQLAEKLLARRPQLAVLFVSGYTDNIIARHGALEEDVDFLEKPFSRSALLCRVREILDRPQQPS